MPSAKRKQQGSWKTVAHNSISGKREGEAKTVRNEHYLTRTTIKSGKNRWWGEYHARDVPGQTEAVGGGGGTAGSDKPSVGRSREKATRKVEG